MTTLNEDLNAMSKSVIVNGRPEKLVYGLSNMKMNQQIEEHIERGWLPIGETKLVGNYFVHKMRFEGRTNYEPNKAF